METPVDLSVQFIEPTVGGLTGEQLSLLRGWEDDERCEFEDELERRCPDDKAAWSSFCDFHTPEYDDFDVWMDYRNYED